MKASPTESWISEYWSQGFTLVRGVFGSEDVRILQAAFEDVLKKAQSFQKTTKEGLTEYRVVPIQGKPVFKFAKWASASYTTLNAYRTDPRLMHFARTLLGDDLRQITNQMHYKNPGDGVSFQFHQDCTFRKPDSAYRNLFRSFVQIGIAVDASTSENGCLRFIPASHRSGDLGLGGYEGEEADALNASILAPFGAPIEALMEPGDLVLWNAYTVHGSQPNRSAHARRVYINGFAKTVDCDHGIETLRKKEIMPLRWGQETLWDHVEER